MSWHGIHGHDEIVEQFRRALERGRLASSFLFIGPEGVGKRTFALKLGQALLCQTKPETDLDPCGQCPACRQAAAGTHPDLDVVAKPEDRSFLPLELLIGDKEHRMREGLCHRIGMRPFMGGRKIAVIDDADYLNPEGANCLLKTLEEPPPRSVLILIGTSAAKQLPTIRSRCQLIRFRPLPAEVVARLLMEQGLVEDPGEAERLAGYSDGSLKRALELADPALWTFRGQLLDCLSRPRLESVRFSKVLLAFLDEAGKEAAVRRARLQQVLGFAGDFYRHLIRAHHGAPGPDDSELDNAVQEAIASGPGNGETASRCLERCLDAVDQLRRNVHLTTLVECWLDDLARIHTGQ